MTVRQSFENDPRPGSPPGRDCCVRGNGGRRLSVALSGEKVLEASRDDLFDALLDPLVLRHAIAGCHRIEEVDENRYQCEIGLEAGPISGTFLASVMVDNIERPWGFSLYGEANGGDGVGGGGGSAHFALAAIDASKTNVAYHVAFVPTGPLAALSNDVLLKMARTLADDFFERLGPLLARRTGWETPQLSGTAAPAGRTLDVVAQQPQPQPEPAPEPLTEMEPPASLTPATAQQRTVAPPQAPAEIPEHRPPDIRSRMRIEPAPTSTPGQNGQSARQTAATGGNALGQVDPALAGWSPSRPGKTLPPADLPQKRNPLRWVFAAVGVFVIILLLSDGF